MEGVEVYMGDDGSGIMYINEPPGVFSFGRNF
jgi:hypothetical protein